MRDEDSFAADDHCDFGEGDTSQERVLRDVQSGAPSSPDGLQCREVEIQDGGILLKHESMGISPQLLQATKVGVRQLGMV